MGQGQSILDSFDACQMVRLAVAWQMQAFPRLKREEQFDWQESGFHHKSLAMGIEVSKVDRLTFNIEDETIA